MTPPIIGLSGNYSSGKSTAAAYITSTRGYPEHSFAAALYDLLWYTCDQIGIPREKDREFLQTIGQWARKKTNSRAWINALERKLAATTDTVIISDVRYPNEAEWIKSKGGIIIRINRDIPRDPQVMAHESETALADYTGFDYIIENNDDLAALYSQLDAIISAL